MAYNSNTQQFNLTLWPSPINGEPLPEGDRYLGYNTVAFELLKATQDKKSSMDFFSTNYYQYPKVSNWNKYIHSLLAKPGTMVLLHNGTPLELNVNYTYNYTDRTFHIQELNVDEDQSHIGILHVQYTPDRSEYLFGTLTAAMLKRNGTKIKRVMTNYVYEIVSSLRTGIEDGWKFLKQNPPLWVGGPDNQGLGSENLIKYLTPISATHFNEIIQEITSLNQYINDKFGISIVESYPSEVIAQQAVDEELIEGLMKGLNDIEDNLNTVLGDTDNHQYLEIE